MGSRVIAMTVAVSAIQFTQLSANSPTFTRDVAPIFHANCLECHRPGEAAPMSLRTYEEARPWAKSIKEKVTSRVMPPWFADPNHGKFRNDPRLTDDQIATIASWVDAGAPRGNPADMPEVPEFTEGWRLGEPDFVIELPEVDVPADGGDYFPDLSITPDMPEDRWVQKVEIRPSNLEVTHHVVIFMGGFGGGGGRRGGGMMGNFDVLGVWSVGTEPNVYPEGTGRRLKQGQRLMTNMHYHPNGTAQKDQTRIGLHFGEGDLQHEIQAALAGSFSLTVPANEANHQEKASWYVDRDIKIISLFPHMHLRGKDMRMTAAYPDGREEVLLNVPGYDFNWQLFYYPEQAIELPAGSRIDILAHYDNSSGNPYNPDPNRSVYFGTSTDDEMLFGIFEYIETGEAVAKVDQLATFAGSFPEGEAFVVRLPLGEASITTVMHLPRVGEGRWLIDFNGTKVEVPIRNLVWDGDTCRADVTLRFGSMGGELKMDATLKPDGTLDGRITSDGTTPFIIPRFEGEKFVRE